jgi:hypothetical protein
MSQIQMTDEQLYGNALLGIDQVKAIQHRHTMGSTLTPVEIRKLVDTALFSLAELEAQLRRDVDEL